MFSCSRISTRDAGLPARVASGSLEPWTQFLPVHHPSFFAGVPSVSYYIMELGRVAHSPLLQAQAGLRTALLEPKAGSGASNWAASSPSARQARRRAHRQSRAVHDPQAQLNPTTHEERPLCHWEGLNLVLLSRAGRELEAMPTEHSHRVSITEFKKVFALLDAAHHGWSHTGAAVLRLWCETVTPFTIVPGTVWDLSSASDTVSEAALTGLLARLYREDQAAQQEQRQVARAARAKDGTSLDHSSMGSGSRAPAVVPTPAVVGASQWPIGSTAVHGALGQIAHDVCVTYDTTPYEPDRAASPMHVAPVPASEHQDRSSPPSGSPPSGQHEPGKKRSPGGFGAAAGAAAGARRGSGAGPGGARRSSNATGTASSYSRVGPGGGL